MKEKVYILIIRFIIISIIKIFKNIRKCYMFILSRIRFKNIFKLIFNTLWNKLDRKIKLKTYELFIMIINIYNHHLNAPIPVISLPATKLLIS